MNTVTISDKDAQVELAYYSISGSEYIAYNYDYEYHITSIRKKP